MDAGFALNWVVSNDGSMTLFGAKDLQLMQALGATTARFEFRLGAARDWTDALLDRFVGVARQMTAVGITPIGLLGADIVGSAQQAQWNAGASEVGGQDGARNPFVEAYLAAARLLAGRVPEVTHWEIWNEPNSWRRNDNGVYSGGSFIYPSVYATLLASTHDVLKQQQPDCTVISGGLLGHNNQGVLSAQNSGAEYLGQVYAALARLGQRAPFDAVGQHLYLDQGGAADPGHLRGYLDGIQQVVLHNEGGNGKPTYITEVAWSTSGVAPGVQAANLRTLFDVCRQSAYVAATCWFQVRDNPPGNQFYGVCAPDGSSKPAFAAFQAATSAV